MSRIEWDETLDTGDSAMDAQHRGLVELVNDLDALDDADMIGIVEILNRLADYAAVHFATEEEFMVRAQYPDEARRAHVLEHRMLERRASTMSIDYRRGWITGTAPLVEYMLSWLRDHIDTQDRQLVEHVRRYWAADDSAG